MRNRSVVGLGGAPGATDRPRAAHRRERVPASGTWGASAADPSGDRVRNRPRPRRPALGPVLVLVLVLVASCSDGGPEVPERAAEDAPGRTTSSTAPPPPALERVSATPSVLEAVGDSRFTGIAVGARAIVVIGELEGEAAIWTTFDGVAYALAPLDRAAFPPGSVLVDLVVATDGFVVVGKAAGRSAAWVSTDGAAWARTDLAGGDGVDTVIAGELGVTAFGRDGATLATWTSFDGFEWQRVPGGAEVFAREGAARVSGAYDDGEGFLVLVDRGGVAETWTSPDGRSWAPAPFEGRELLPADGPPRPRTLLGAGSTAVVLGAVEDPDGTDAAVWTSLSGEPWERATPSEEVFGGDGAQVAGAAVQLGADLVAVGTDTDEEGDVDAVVWSTGDGGGWRRSAGSPDDGLSGPGDQHAVDLAPTRDGALVVGWEEGPAGVRAVAWRLVDGDATAAVPVPGPVLPWQRVPRSEALGGPGEQRLDAAAAFEDGLVAVGSSSRPDAPEGDVDGAVWRSTDGVEWERVDATGLAGPGDQRVLDVTATGPGLVAVGSDAGGAAIWSSADGAAWTRAAPDEAVVGGPGDQVATAVVAGTDGSVVAVGSDGGSGDGDAAVWRSSDGGATWARLLPGGDLGGPGAQAMADVVVAGPLLVAVGQGGAGAVAWSSLDGTTWQRAALGGGRVEALAVGDVGVVAVGSIGDGGGGLDGRAWRSEEGRTWTEVDIDDGLLGGADQELLDVVVTGPAAGEPLVAAVGRTNLGPGDDGAAWAGDDGTAWVRAPHDEDVYGGDQAQRMAGLVELGEVVVAVGSSGSSPASRDGAVWVTGPVTGGGGVL